LKLIEDEDSINESLRLSKPLVTDLMEEFVKKEEQSKQEIKMDVVVTELRTAIEEIMMAEEKFQKAA